MSQQDANAAKWRGMVRDQECSGLSVTAFCRRRGVAQSTFYAWRRKLAGAASFAEVKVSPDSAREAAGIELRLAGGDCVVIWSGFDRQTLIDLLHVLRASLPDAAATEADA